MPEDAMIVINADGTYRDGTPAALAILGVTREQLTAMPPGAFAARPRDPAEAAAFRSSWEAEGAPEIAGETTIRRPDGGGERRIAFRVVPQADRTFLAQLTEIDAPTSEPTRLYTTGEILARWREAERRLEAITAESPDWAAIHAEIDRLRAAYQHAFRSLQDREETA